MVRISDILKKMRQYQGEEKEGGYKTTPAEKPPQYAKEKLKPEEAKEGEGEISSKDHITFIDAMKKGRAPEKPLEAHIHEIVRKAMPEKGQGQNIYNEAIECFSGVTTAYGENSQEAEKTAIIDICEKIADYILFGGKELLSLIHEHYPHPDNYRLYDLVNTSILAGHIGEALGYNKSKLVEVIIVGLFHDVSFFSNLHFVNEPRQLTVEEWNEVKGQPEKAASYIAGLGVFSQEIIEGVLHHHERINGEGYPQCLSGDDISEYGQIVGISDAYEAMIHYRPHKNSILPASEVLKEIISLKDVLFNARIIKALIETIGIYPVGSWVEINTGEICRVLSTNENLPLRPVLSIVFDKDRKRLKEIQTIDLKSNTSLYIKHAAEEKDLK